MKTFKKLRKYKKHTFKRLSDLAGGTQKEDAEKLLDQAEEDYNQGNYHHFQEYEESRVNALKNVKSGTVILRKFCDKDDENCKWELCVKLGRTPYPRPVDGRHETTPNQQPEQQSQFVQQPTGNNSTPQQPQFVQQPTQSQQPTDNSTTPVQSQFAQQHQFVKQPTQSRQLQEQKIKGDLEHYYRIEKNIESILDDLINRTENFIKEGDCNENSEWLHLVREKYDASGWVLSGDEQDFYNQNPCEYGITDKEKRFLGRPLEYFKTGYVMGWWILKSYENYSSKHISDGGVLSGRTVNATYNGVKITINDLNNLYHSNLVKHRLLKNLYHQCVDREEQPVQQPEQQPVQQQPVQQQPVQQPEQQNELIKYYINGLNELSIQIQNFKLPKKVDDIIKSNKIFKDLEDNIILLVEALQKEGYSGNVIENIMKKLMETKENLKKVVSFLEKQREKQSAEEKRAREQALEEEMAQKQALEEEKAEKKQYSDFKSMVKRPGLDEGSKDWKKHLSEWYFDDVVTTLEDLPEKFNTLDKVISWIKENPNKTRIKPSHLDSYIEGYTSAFNKLNKLTRQGSAPDSDDEEEEVFLPSAPVSEEDQGGGKNKGKYKKTKNRLIKMRKTKRNY